MKINFDINNFIEDFKSSCHKVQKKTFNKGEVITSYIQKRNQFCILISGNADLVRYDYNGDRTIVEHFAKNDIFGEVFYPANTNNELFAVAHKNSEVLFYTYESLSNKCKKNCEFHKELTNSLGQLFLDKIVELNLRIELLTTKSTREKILSYFRILSKGSLRRTFTLPYSYTDLADFLSVDRSAMMRELKLLIDEGFIKKNGNKITLLY